MKKLNYFLTGGPAFAQSFRLFQKLGFDTSIVFGHHINGRTEEREISHIEYDGMNGLTEQLRQTGTLTDQSFPQVPLRKRGFLLFTLIRRFFQYFRILWQFSRKSQEWRVEPRKVAVPFTVWKFFTPEETEASRQAAKAAGVSLNSHLLFHLNETVKPRMAPSKHPSTWIVPVSLYASAEQVHEPGMRTSVMEVGLMPNDGPVQVHAKVRKEVDQESYWGAIVAVLINHFLPARLNSAILAATVATKRRVGTFSNLGRWTGNEKASDEAWSVVPPVHPGQPLGVGVIEFNGKLGVGMKFDPYLGMDEAEGRFVLERFKESLTKWRYR